MKCNWCSARFNKNSGNGGLLHHKKTKHFWGIFKCVQCTFIGEGLQWPGKIWLNLLAIFG